jgi:hypothetical protein
MATDVRAALRPGNRANQGDEEQRTAANQYGT